MPALIETVTALACQPIHAEPVAGARRAGLPEDERPFMSERFGVVGEAAKVIELACADPLRLQRVAALLGLAVHHHRVVPDGLMEGRSHGPGITVAATVDEKVRAVGIKADVSHVIVAVTQIASPVDDAPEGVAVAPRTAAHVKSRGVESVRAVHGRPALLAIGDDVAHVVSAEHFVTTS